MSNASDEITRITAFRPGRFAAARSAFVARRSWTRRERAAVLAGCERQLGNAAGPALRAVLLGMFVFDRDLLMLTPIFVLGLVACCAWAAALLAAPVRRLLRTFRPIFIVDGYVRSRPTDPRSRAGTNGYVAVLTDARELACEWATVGNRPMPPALSPALVEFTTAAPLRIDGRPCPDSLRRSR
jgi:hypothetical protein